MKNKIVLITGGAGAIGSRLIEKLSPICKKIVVIDNLSSGYLWNVPSFDNVMFIQGDITNDIDLRRCFSESPDIIFHLAAFFANQNSVDYPQSDLLTNGVGTLKLYEYAAMCGKVERFIYASSGSSIYGNTPIPYVEENVDMMNLTTPYQITKGLGELYGRYFLHQFDLPVVFARFFNSFGPGEIPGQYRNVIPNFIYWAKKGYPLPITGTGQETRDFTYVYDIVDGLISMATTKGELVIGESFNLSANREIKIIDLANKINKITGNKREIVFKQKRKWDAKPRRLAENSKAKSILNFKVSLDFDSCLNEACSWFEENWVVIDNFNTFYPGISSAVR